MSNTAVLIALSAVNSANAAITSANAASNETTVEYTTVPFSALPIEVQVMLVILSGVGIVVVGLLLWMFYDILFGDW